MAHCPSWLFIRDLQVPPSSEKTYNAIQFILITIPFNYFSLDVHLYWLFIRDFGSQPSIEKTCFQQSRFALCDIMLEFGLLKRQHPLHNSRTPKTYVSFCCCLLNHGASNPQQGYPPPTTQSLPKPSILFVAQPWGFKPSKGLSTPQNSELR